MNAFKTELEDTQHSNIAVAKANNSPDSGANLTINRLHDEAEKFADNGGNSKNNKGMGFTPAFIDKETGFVYLSRFSDGNPAPLHLLDGLPDFLIQARDDAGKVVAVKANVEAGFYRAGFYYTRDAAAKVVAQEEKTI